MECQSKKEEQGETLTTAKVSNLMEAVGSKTIGSVNVLTDMVLATQLKVGELDCEVTKVEIIYVRPAVSVWFLLCAVFLQFLGTFLPFLFCLHFFVVFRLRVSCPFLRES